MSVAFQPLGIPAQMRLDRPILGERGLWRGFTTSNFR